MAPLWTYFLLLTLTIVACDRYHDDVPSPHHAAQTQNVPTDIKRDWMALGRQELNFALDLRRNMGVAKNVILFIGDGMGVSTTSAARIFNLHVKGKSWDDSAMFWERFNHTGLSKTYNTDRYTPDSAGTATAFLTGNKAPYGTIGVNQNVTRGDCASITNNNVTSILRYAQAKGKLTGIVTSTRVTHATPAAAYAHSPERSWEARSPEANCKDMARQLVEDNSDIRVILGGGRSAFYPANTTDPEYPNRTLNRNSGSVRQDGMHLIELWQNDKNVTKGLAQSKYKYVEKKEDFDSVNVNEVDYLLGLFEPSHMQYEADRPNDTWKEPSLAEMTRKAIQILKRGSQGFFLEVEGGRIDHAHHDTNAYRSLHDVLALSEAVEAAYRETNPEETLIVVSADHSHVFALGGYPKWTDHILGFPDGWSSSSRDGKPYTVLGYTNGPGFAANNEHSDSSTKIRKNLTNTDTRAKEYLQDTTVHINSETHGGEDVGIYASGPMAHLFHGTHEQSYIAHVMMYASCVGPYPEHCQGGPKVPPDCPTPTVPPASAADAMVTRRSVPALLLVLVTVSARFVF